MKKIFCLLIIVCLNLPNLILAEELSSKIGFSETKEEEVIELKTSEDFKLLNLKQDQDPARLILIFKSSEEWPSQKYDLTSTIKQINLTNISKKKHKLIIEFKNTEIPDFDLKNQLGNLKVSFTKNSILETEERLTTPDITEEKVNKKQILKKKILKLKKNVRKTSQAQTDAESESSLVLSTIKFFTQDQNEKYLILKFSKKPNFRFSVKPDNKYEVIVPNYKLVGKHLENVFYAPKTHAGFLFVKAEEGKDNNLFITIKVEKNYKLVILPTKDGIRASANPK